MCASGAGELGELVDEVFVPLVQEPGAEAEVDWGEATVVIAGVPTKVHLFQMRACFSGACFVVAFERETQQAFLEGHVAAFEFFGGVFGPTRYDNLRLGGQAGAERPPAGRDRSVRRAALALPL